MDNEIKGLLERHAACARERQWKRLAYKIKRDSGRDVPPEELKALALGLPIDPPGNGNVKVSTKNTSPDTQIVDATSQEDVIRTLDDLIRVAEIDLDTWKVNSWTSNTWTNNNQRNWQVKANLHRLISADDFLESLRPTNSATTPYKPRKDKDKTGTLLVISDCQIGMFWEHGHLYPYHDRKAMDATWQVAEHEQPDTIVIVGDYLDLAIWSTKFQREPKDRYTTKHAIKEARWWLTRLRNACPNSRIVFLEGNHEKRIQTVLIEYFQELSTLDLIDVQQLLGTEDIGIEYRGPYGKEATYFFDGNLLGYHGDVVRQGGGVTSCAVAKNKTTSVFFGHTHRLGYSSRAVHDPDGVHVISAMEVGCCCRLDGVVPGDNSPDWAHGYGWATYQNGQVFQQPVAIHDGLTMLPSGGTVQGDDCWKEIAEDLLDTRIR